MKKLPLFILMISFCWISCGKTTRSQNNSNDPVGPISKDTSLFGLTIPKDYLDELNSVAGKSPQQLRINYGSSYENGKEIPNDSLINGIEWFKLSEKDADKMIDRFQKKLIGANIYLFKKNIGFDDVSFDELSNGTYETYYDLAAYPDDDVYTIIQLWDVNGINYDIENEDVIKKIKEWDEKYGIEINTIDMDRIHGKFRQKIPVKEMAKEIYAFCPDVIDQGYGSMEEFQKDLENTNAFWMWWD